MPAEEGSVEELGVTSIIETSIMFDGGEGGRFEGVRVEMRTRVLVMMWGLYKACCRICGTTVISRYSRAWGNAGHLVNEGLAIHEADG